MAERGERAGQELPHRPTLGDAASRAPGMVLGPKVKCPPPWTRCGLRLVQVRLATGLTSEEYVRQKVWLTARLERCPFHPGGGCGFESHGTYERVSPPGCLIARSWCPTAHISVSLLPDFLCAGLTGTLAEVEAAVAAAEAAPTRETASEVVRPEIELPGAMRWMRRRIRLVRAGLAAGIGLLPGLLAGCTPTVTSIRSALGAEPAALVRLRVELAPYLAALPMPLGFGPRPARRRPSSTATQQEAGPDPPPGTR